MFKKLGITAVLTASLIGGLIAQAKSVDNAGRLNQIGKMEGDKMGFALEVHISNNGKVLVRGAKVTGISSSTVNATTIWDSVAMNWAIVTDDKTEFVHRSEGAASLAEVKIGDIISFHGNLDTTVASPLTVRASIVKDWSLEKTITTLEGRVKSLNPFVITVKDKDYTIAVSTSTSVLNASWLRAQLANVRVGDTVRVYGAVNIGNGTVDGTVVRDVSLR